MKHKPYPKYKDSGVEWLGEVPEHWEVWKIGHLTTKIGSGKTPTGGAEVYQSEGVLFIRSQNVYDEGLRLGDVVFIDSVTDEEMAWARVQANDILLNITGASLGRTCIVPKDMPPANVNQHVCIIRMRNREYADYVSWYLKSNIAKSFYDIAQTGSAREGLNFEQISIIQTLLPSLPEQQSIAGFLDRKTAKIDALIDKKQELVKRLQEKRSAVISHAVTKGINPKVKMKSSGVEWWGNVPEHWTVTAIKRIVAIPVTDGPHETPEIIDEGVPFISAEAIKDNKIDFSRKRGFISEEEHRRFCRKYKPKRDDIYMIKSGATTGNIAIVETDEEFSIWSPLAVIRADLQKADPRYLLAAMNSKEFQSSVQLFWSFGTQQNIGMSVIENLVIPMPPLLSEQQAIAAFIDSETGRFDALITTVENAIKKLKEYRAALISAAVTGKFDVRGTTE